MNLRLFPNDDETIAGAGQALRAGKRTCQDLLEGCLAQVEEWEPKVHAWVILDREGARAQARQLDQELSQGLDRGPLHGIPIGIKDIIDVAGMPTACGSSLMGRRTVTEDAPLVARLREAGAVLMGKTVTTQYAWIDPPVTRNPWNLERTPGGSSSGSAAAVACGMCLGAIGSQTGGSITRPASFCGVAGFKPIHGNIDVGGILSFSPSLDHPGPIARTVRDLALIYQVIGRTRAVTWRAEELDESDDPPVLGRLRGLFETDAEPAMRQGFDTAIGRLAGAGAEVREASLPPSFDEVVRSHRTIMCSEAAAGHERRLGEVPHDYLPEIARLLQEGLATRAVDYIRAREHQKKIRQAFESFFEAGDHDALITPATTGPAPDPSTTGKTFFNSPWSYAGLPTVSIPFGTSPEGLPLAIQLIGGTHELDLFEVALWCERVLRRSAESAPRT